MMRAVSRGLVLGFMALVPLVGVHAGEADAPVVELSAETQQRAGVAVQRLEAVMMPEQRDTMARVLDPAPLLQLDADLIAARASRYATRAEASRAHQLYADEQNVSGKVRDSTKAMYQADEARVLMLNRRLRLEWGSAIADLREAERSRLADALAAGETQLVRVEIPLGTPDSLNFEQAQLLPSDGGLSIGARILGPLRDADPKLLSRGVLARVEGAAGRLPLGSPMMARLAVRDSLRAGVVLPRSALIRYEGQTWTYVQRDATHFERRAVDLSLQLPSGWFVAQAYAVGEPLVVVGAMQLLAAEKAARPSQSEEDGGEGGEQP